VAIFLTGSTGYIGGYIAANLLSEHGASLNLLVRARDAHEAEDRLWRSLQLHFDFTSFYEYLQTRIRVFRGDLTEDGFGLSRDDYDRLVHTTDSVIHCAASLNLLVRARDAHEAEDRLWRSFQLHFEFKSFYE